MKSPNWKKFWLNVITMVMWKSRKIRNIWTVLLLLFSTPPPCFPVFKCVKGLRDVFVVSLWLSPAIAPTEALYAGISDTQAKGLWSTWGGRLKSCVIWLWNRPMGVKSVSCWAYTCWHRQYSSLLLYFTHRGPLPASDETLKLTLLYPNPLLLKMWSIRGSLGYTTTTSTTHSWLVSRTLSILEMKLEQAHVKHLGTSW